MRRWMIPSLLDLLFLAVVVSLVAFTIGNGSKGLLQDAGTGVHIRTGEMILATGAVPQLDPFSFSKPAAPWYAWEWLADVLMALLYGSAGGLKGIILASAFALGGTVIASVLHMGYRGANAIAILVVMNAVMGAGSVHFLARPHLGTLLFLVCAFWLIDFDRSTPTRWLWALVPLTAVWANLHGGFAGLVITLAVVAAGTLCEGKWRAAGRYALVAASCLAASVLNPYGFQLLVHMQAYLRAGWIREIVLEFQAPRLETSQGMYYEALLFTGLVVAGRLAWKKRFAEALLIAAWGHASLLSVRHAPIFAFCVAPYLAEELTLIMRSAAEGARRSSVWRILNSVAESHTPGLRRVSILVPALMVAACVSNLGVDYPTDFPADRFPVVAVEKKAAALASRRHFSLDYWGDYMIWRLASNARVFFDGRTDYYGEEMSRDYMTLVNGTHGWEKVLAKYRIDAVMLPETCPLVESLRADKGWRLEFPEPGLAYLEKL